MNCPICLHDWCWTCGYPSDHLFHSYWFFGGVLCQLFNAVSFGFEMPIHWVFRFLLTILSIPLAPVIFLVGCAIAFFVFLCEEWRHSCLTRLFCCIESDRLSCWKLCIFWLPCFFVQMIIMFGFWMVGACILLALFIVPFYLTLIVLCLRLLFRWCCCSKRRKKTKE